MAVGYANRGKSLEIIIEQTNAIYLQRKAAHIQKIPTPIKVLKINKFGKITNGHFEKKSTVDFKGVWNGRSLAFDAKSTRIETSFKLSEVKDHQIEDLKSNSICGGISFLIIEFIKNKKSFILLFDDFMKYKEAADRGSRKSIPYDDFVQNFQEIKWNSEFGFDYLKALEASLDGVG